MINKYLSVIALFLVSALFSFSQNRVVSTFCGTNQSIYDKIAQDPAFAKEWDSIKQVQREYHHQYSQTQEASRAGVIYYVPVVYHILHLGGEENISDEQIKGDLVQLNNMFRKLNPSWVNVNNNFTPADVEIQFLLAQKKNDGTCFSGITRTYSTLTNHNGNSGGVANAVKAVHGDFPGNKYLNIFVCKSIGGAAGYTTQPWITDMSNGIFILHDYVGTTGTSNFPTENATTAHEAGHWLNLDHTWGPSNNPGQPSNCSDDDGIADTPNTIGWVTCNPTGSSCSSLDNVENIMEYSYCPNHMFSAGQKSVMRAAATNFIGGRNNVTSASNHTATGIFADVLCESDFSTDRSVICEGDQVQFYDGSYHNATSWNWSFPGGTPSSSTQRNPIVTYSNPGIYDATLVATNTSGSKTKTKQAIKVLGYYGVLPPIYEGFEASTSLPSNLIKEGNATNNWSINNSIAYTGTKSAYVQNFNNTESEVADLSSETIGLQPMSSATLNFKYAYARKTTTIGESIRLLFSKDCGETWTLMKTLSTTVPSTNNSFIPAGSGDWDAQSVNIPATFLVWNFRYMFSVTNKGGNNFYLDDINIDAVVSIDELDAIQEFSVSPNPFSDNATVSFSLIKDSKVSITLVDLVGKNVKPILSESNLSGNSPNTYFINKGDLTKGIYFIKLNINDQVRLEKIVIN